MPHQTQRRLPVPSSRSRRPVAGSPHGRPPPSANICWRRRGKEHPGPQRTQWVALPNPRVISSPPSRRVRSGPCHASPRPPLTRGWVPRSGPPLVKPLVWAVGCPSRAHACVQARAVPTLPPRIAFLKPPLRRPPRPLRERHVALSGHPQALSRPIDGASSD